MTSQNNTGTGTQITRRKSVPPSQRRQNGASSNTSDEYDGDRVWSFKTLPVRALGYGFAVGEALAYVSRSYTVVTCYNVGAAFIFAHCCDSLIKRGMRPFFKTLLWEIPASAVLPTMITYYASRITWLLLSDLSGPHAFPRYAASFVGLMFLPLIIEPIDNYFDDLIERIFQRKN